MPESNEKEKDKKLNKHDEDYLEEDELDVEVLEDEKDSEKENPNQDASNKDPHIINYRKTKEGNKIVEEYTIIEENPNIKDDLVDIAKIKAQYENLPEEDRRIEPDNEMYADFYENLLKDSDIFPEADINDPSLEETPENVLELDSEPQISR